MKLVSLSPVLLLFLDILLMGRIRGKKCTQPGGIFGIYGSKAGHSSTTKSR